MIVFALIAVALVTFANGANDNFKGVASLWGSHTLGYRQALSLATLSTMLGSFASLALAGTLTARFSGKGLVPDALVHQTPFLTAVALGAAVTVVIATRLGLPVSTTHALLGGLLGTGLALSGPSSIRLEALWNTLILPLALSPVLAGGAAALLYAPLHERRRRSALAEDACVCVGSAGMVTAGGPGVGFAASSVALVQVGSSQACAEAGVQQNGVVLQVAPVLDRMHLLTAAGVGFCRGMNDTPKIAALLVVAPALSRFSGVSLVAALMALGGVLGARRVAQTLSWRITALNAGQATTASFVTALLVAAASFFALPVSTTHVSCGALIGIGSVSGNAQWSTIRSILMAWGVTLPVAALAGYLSALALR